MPDAAKIHAPLINLIPDATKNHKRPVPWASEADSGFEKCEKSLTDAVQLAFPSPDATLKLRCDAFDKSIGAAFDQFVEGRRELLGFFTQKLSKTESNYSAYDRELLHSDKASPRQQRQLQYIRQFSTDIKHVSGKSNVIADALSRIYTISLLTFISIQDIADAQANDDELKHLLKSKFTSLQLRQYNIDDAGPCVYCDTSKNSIHLYTRQPLRRQIFDTIHNPSHSNGRSTRKSVSQLYVCPHMNRDVTRWAKSCLQCQRSKVNRHVKNITYSIKIPSECFKHVHTDIIVVPLSKGYRYCLTIIDRFSRWPEAIPLKDTIADAFFTGWLSRFGSSLTITSDRSTQFESKLFGSLTKLLGCDRTRTTAYHPASNGIIERWHRSMKSAIMCHSSGDWTANLPVVILGLRNSLKEDIKSSAAEMLYGTTLWLPGELFIDEELNLNPQIFIQKFGVFMREVRSAPTAHHNKARAFAHKTLYICSHVFISVDEVKEHLEQPYRGPYEIIHRQSDYVFIVNVDIQLSALNA